MVVAGCTTLNVLKATELYTLNGQIVWYVNSISINLGNKTGCTALDTLQPLIQQDQNKRHSEWEIFLISLEAPPYS